MTIEETIIQEWQRAFPTLFTLPEKKYIKKDTAKCLCKYAKMHFPEASKEDVKLALEEWRSDRAYKLAAAKYHRRHKNLSVNGSACLYRLMHDFPNTFDIYNFKLLSEAFDDYNYNILKDNIVKALYSWRVKNGISYRTLYETLSWYMNQKEYKKLLKRKKVS